MSGSGAHLARRRTLTLAAVLAGTALALSVAVPAPPIVRHGHALWLTVSLLLVGYLLGEQLLLNIEFKKQAHSMTLGGIPLIIGILLLPLPHLVLARVVGAGLALVIQRIRPDKIVYNCSAWAFEAAVDSAVLHELLGRRSELGLVDVIVLMAVALVVDQIMSCLVLVVIRLHGGVIDRAGAVEVLAPAAVLAGVSTLVAVGFVLLLGNGAVGLVIIAVLVGASLAVYRSHVVTKRRHQRLELVHDFVSGSRGAESLVGVTADLLGRIRAALRAESATVHVIVSHTGERPSTDGRTKILQMTDDERKGFSSTETELAFDWVLRRAVDDAQPMLASRSSEDAAVRAWLARSGHRDAIVVPLPTAGGLRGAVTVVDRLGETASFTADDLQLLQTLTGHLAVAGVSAKLVEQLAYDASHDALTGLANRTFLSQQIAEHLTRPDAAGCVVLLDLDRFKEVNDGFGHEAGDELLCAVAGRLTALLPAEAIVARLGGDEFAILFPGAVDADGVEALGVAITRRLEEPLVVAEAQLTPEASIGFALIRPPDAWGCRPMDHSDLLRQADTAMYAAKRGDRSVAVYHPEMDRGRAENLALLADLRVALREQPEQIAVYFQPKIDAGTGVVVGAESLVRWHSPVLGVVPPDRFIPLVESTGLIHQFTPLVLESALRECRRWRDAGHDVTVAVNLSARNISDPTMVDAISAALRRTGVPAASLTVEITESSFIDDPDQALMTLRRLADLGVSVSLDDFGTGYSSLAYLQRMPVSEVKIDKSFVNGLRSDDPHASRALISTIVGLGRNLGIRVVAEGVEDADVMAELRDLGCDVLQGYLFSRPLQADDFNTWLGARNPVATREVRPLAIAG